MSAWNVHTSVPINGYELNGRQPAPLFDPESGLTSLEADCVFHGTRDQCVDFFAFGKQNAPSGGTGMFSLSPASVEMVPFTEDDPHWDVRARWLGLHSDYSGPVFKTNYAFNFMVDYGARSMEFPVEIPTPAGTPYVVTAPKGFAPQHTNQRNSGKDFKARRKDWIPVLRVLAVMKHTIPPHPAHPTVAAILNAVPVALYDDLTAAYSTFPDPVWVTWKDNEAPEQSLASLWPSKAAWFPTISMVRRIPAASGAESLYVFTMECPLEPQIQPG